MELINECSLRFAEDKDYRLLVHLTLCLALMSELLLDRRLYHGSI